MPSPVRRNHHLKMGYMLPPKANTGIIILVLDDSLFCSASLYYCILLCNSTYMVYKGLCSRHKTINQKVNIVIQ